MGDLPSDPLNFFWAGEQYKKEMLVDGQTHLVLIREEAGAPDAKVRHAGSGHSRLGSVPDTEAFPGLLGDPLNGTQREWACVTSVCFLVPCKFSGWADAVIFVFSLEDESSFQAVSRLHGQLSSLRGEGRGGLALALVGTQGKERTWKPCV